MGRDSFSYSRLVVFLILAIIIVGFSVFGLSIAFNFGPRLNSSVGNSMVEATNQSLSFWNVISHWRSFSNVFSDLESERLKNEHLRSEVDSLSDENESLRLALNLRQRRGFELIGPAGVFSYRITPIHDSFLINKGTRDGVRAGDVVISANSELLGLVIDTQEMFSTVKDIRSTESQVTARVVGRETQGLIKGNDGEELLLDLVTQNDEVAEGDVIVSSGNDLYPSGLVIGTISYISSNTTNIFKEIRVKPYINNIQSNVFIISI